MHTRLLNENEVARRVKKACEDISQICNSGDSFTSLGYHRDPVQTLIMRRGSNQDSLVTPIIESSAIQAEKQAAGAGELFLKIFAQEMSSDVIRRSIGLGSDKEWDDILFSIEKSSIPARKRDISALFDSAGSTFRIIIENFFEIACADDKVMVRKSAASLTSISRDSGYTFENLGIDPRFFSRGQWSKNSVRCVLIDGIIESVSEIHSFLEEVSKSKTPCVIFCLDALPDVHETLVKNFLIGNLDVILVKIPIDEFNINTMVDLGMILCVEPISASKGDSISLGIKNQISFADKFSISRGKIGIERRETNENVKNHILNLRKRIDDNINLAQILEPRIRNLSSSTIRISVGVDDLKRDPNLIEKLDRTFRSLPKIIKSGFIEKNELKGFSSSKIDLLFDKNNVEPAEMVVQAIKVFLSTRNSIGTAGAGIETIQFK